MKLDSSCILDQLGFRTGISDHSSTLLEARTVLNQSGAVMCPLPSGSGQGLSQSIVDIGHLMLSGAYRPLCLGYIFCRK